MNLAQAQAIRDDRIPALLSILNDVCGVEQAELVFRAENRQLAHHQIHVRRFHEQPGRVLRTRQPGDDTAAGRWRAGIDPGPLQGCRVQDGPVAGHVHQHDQGVGEESVQIVDGDVPVFGKGFLVVAVANEPPAGTNAPAVLERFQCLENSCNVGARAHGWRTHVRPVGQIKSC